MHHLNFFRHPVSRSPLSVGQWVALGSGWSSSPEAAWSAPIAPFGSRGQESPVRSFFVTTSKAPVTTSVALVPSSVLVTTSKALVTRSDALVTSSFLLLVV